MSEFIMARYIEIFLLMMLSRQENKKQQAPEHFDSVPMCFQNSSNFLEKKGHVHFETAERLHMKKYLQFFRYFYNKNKQKKNNI